MDLVTRGSLQKASELSTEAFKQNEKKHTHCVQTHQIITFIQFTSKNKF